MGEPSITVEVYRSTAAGAQSQRFEVPYRQRHSVLTVLAYIYETADPTLAFRHYQCGRGICNSCRMNINGKERKACATVVPPGTHIVLRPSRDPLVRDLVTILGGNTAEP